MRRVSAGCFCHRVMEKSTRVLLSPSTPGVVSHSEDTSAIGLDVVISLSCRVQVIKEYSLLFC